jgi:hypothetical protein
MATLVVASIIVDADDPAVVNRAMKDMLRSAVFESGNPIVDFDITLGQASIAIKANLDEGHLLGASGLEDMNR